MQSTIQLQRLADLERLTAFVETTARAAGAGHEARFALRLAVEEAFTNIMRHGYRGNGGPVSVVLSSDGQAVTVILRDHADPFDPDSITPVDTARPLQQRQPGGLGWHLLRQSCDRVHYQRHADGTNVLTLVKHMTEAQGSHIPGAQS